MSKAKNKRAPKPQVTIDQPPPRAQAKPAQAAITMSPQSLITDARKTTHNAMQTFASTALAISNSENAAEKVGVLQAVWNMQKEAEDRQAEREFNAAKVNVALKLPSIPKSGKREFVDKNTVLQSSTYSTLDDIEGVLDPICREVGMVKEYSSRTNDKGWACQVLTIRHVSGHKEVYESPYMPLDTSGSKNNQQGAGSTAKYGRRYALIGAFNIYHVDEDTDGALPTDTGKDADKFTQRVQAEAAQPDAKAGSPVKLSLPDAAKALEDKIRNCPQNARGALLMKHINIIGEMEKDTALSAKAADLRKLCEEAPNAA